MLVGVGWHDASRLDHIDGALILQSGGSDALENTVFWSIGDVHWLVTLSADLTSRASGAERSEAITLVEEQLIGLARVVHAQSGTAAWAAEFAETSEDPDASARFAIRDACLEQMPALLREPTVFSPAEARIERRSLNPAWFVYVPGSPLAATCVFGGELGDPELAFAGTSYPLNEDMIQLWITSNETFTH